MAISTSGPERRDQTFKDLGSGNNMRIAERLRQKRMFGTGPQSKAPPAAKLS
jgi:hypothetical protein